MIASGDGSVLVSSMGWVDRDALWVFDVPSRRETRIPLDSGARHLSLHCCHASYFAVLHHFDGTGFEVTIRRFDRPERIAARGGFRADCSSVQGEAGLWHAVPHLYVGYVKFAPWNDFVLLRVLPEASRIDVQRMAWYDETYDKGYQGVIGVLQLSRRNLAIVAVQRSSRLVVHDLASGKSRGTIDLAGQGGNPELRMRRTARELWASDYDSLVVVDPDTWTVMRRARLQTALAGTQQFIGGYAFDRDERVCAVARPFSGDVVGVDPVTMNVTGTAEVGGQPFEVALVGDDEIIARDWKSGRLLLGRLAKRRWWRFG